MSVKDQSRLVRYQAFNTVTGEYVAGDQANHTLEVLSDTSSNGAPSNSPSNEGSGDYTVLLTAGENDGNQMQLRGTSSTANVIIIGYEWENLPIDLETLNTNIATMLAQFNLVVQFDGAEYPDERILRLVRGDSYDDVLNPKVAILVTSDTDLTTGTADLTTRDLDGNLLFTTSVTPVLVSGTTYACYFTVTTVHTGSLPVGRAVGTWDCQITVGSSVATPVLGTLRVDEDVTT